MRRRTTGQFLRQYLPWAILISSGIGWGLLLFERHIREDQHEQDIAMFRDWVTTHQNTLKETPITKESD